MENIPNLGVLYNPENIMKPFLKMKTGIMKFNSGFKMKAIFKPGNKVSVPFFYGLFLLLLTSGNAFSQINMEEMNGIHLDYAIEEAEQKIGQKLKLKKTKDGYGGYNFRTSVVYNGINYQLVFSTLEDENDLSSYYLESISTRSEKAKTNLGIHIGSTLKEVQDACKIYEKKEGFSINQGPEALDPGDTTVEYFQIYDSESGHLLRFSFKNNKFSEIEIASVDSI